MKIKINQVEQLVLSSNQIYFVFPKKKLGCEGNLSKLLIQKASRNMNQIGIRRSKELEDYKRTKTSLKNVLNLLKTSSKIVLPQNQIYQLIAKPINSPTMKNALNVTYVEQSLQKRKPQAHKIIN